MRTDTEMGMPGTGEASTFVVGPSRSMQGLERLITELADSPMPVLLISEPGCGKRATAEHIHRLSARAKESFVVMTAAELSNGSEGQEIAEKFFRSGSLYLEEVGNLTLEGQKALLSLIVGGGDDDHQPQRARLLCGTERDLELEVREARFREDLHYSISGLSLRLPPLRQRKEDLLHLLSFFLRRYAAEFHCAIPTLSRETQQLFVEYSWPGNLRELEEAARLIAMVGDEALAMGGLRSLFSRGERTNGHRVSLKEAAKAASREAEKQLILQVLTRTRWNRRRAAEELKISYKALLYKLKQIGYGELGGAS
ncbi:MAG TPA: sigma 54-interacting transcriptional regulator [Terriglobales bacterium]|nr:sigma 54-interacting transcriptional regulator [Terriglobales bacterium]